MTAYPGTEVNIPINVTADDEKPINGNITVYFPDGTNQTVTIINGTGTATWHVPDYFDEGNYSMNAVFDGNDTYLPSNGSGIISIICIDVQLNITVDKSTVYYGDVVEFVISVRNNGSGDATGVIVENMIPEEFEYISDNCSDNNYQNIKGLLMASATTQSYDPDTGIWYIGNLANGEEAQLRILAYAKFIGTKDVNSSVSIAETNYTRNNCTVSVNAVQVPTEISVNNVTARPDENINIAVNVTADDDVPFFGNVTVTLPDGSNQTVEIINGTGNTTWIVPEGYEGEYQVNVTFEGNDRYLPSNGTGTVTVTVIPKTSVEIIVDNVTAKPGDNVTIPINVIPKDGSTFNGSVTVTLPDGTKKVIEIINGTGSADWIVPENYDGVYSVIVTFDGDDTYLAANATGFITVIQDTPTEPVSPSVKEVVPMDEKATGNPIIALIAVFALLGINIKRRK